MPGRAPSRSATRGSTAAASLADRARPRAPAGGPGRGRPRHAARWPECSLGRRARTGRQGAGGPGPDGAAAARGARSSLRPRMSSAIEPDGHGVTGGGGHRTTVVPPTRGAPRDRRPVEPSEVDSRGSSDNAQVPRRYCAMSERSRHVRAQRTHRSHQADARGPPAGGRAARLVGRTLPVRAARPGSARPVSDWSVPPGQPGSPVAGQPPRPPKGPNLFRQATSTTGGPIALIVAAGLALLLVLGVAGVGAWPSRGRWPATTTARAGWSRCATRVSARRAPGAAAAPGQGERRSARSRHGVDDGRARRARRCPARRVHGAGRYRRVDRDDVQRGTVTAACASSVTVKSADGFTATYAVDASTRGATTWPRVTRCSSSRRRPAPRPSSSGRRAPPDHVRRRWRRRLVRTPWCPPRPRSGEGGSPRLPRRSSRPDRARGRGRP